MASEKTVPGLIYPDELNVSSNDPHSVTATTSSTIALMLRASPKAVR